ncbi:MAG: hypothetical protein GY774_28680 [Planctomycetes bacterium]|nr:hypothetical protein [Planctomycetota bacterium]
MTRRKFINKLIKTGSIIIAGISCLAKNANPRKFVRAMRIKKYPGRLKPLRDISKQCKWSG